MLRTRLPRERSDWMLLALAAAIALFVGLLITRSPVIAVGPVAALLAAVGLVRFGTVGIALPPLLLCPWLLVFDDLIPPLLRTLTVAAAAGALIVAVAPLRYEQRLVPIAAVIFLTLIGVQALISTDSEQLIQAAKYLIFPTMALAVTSDRSREVMSQLFLPVFASTLAAMAAHIGVIGAGLGATGTYYGAGEKLGFAPAIPHELALLGVVVAAAGLTVRRTWMQVLFFSIGAVPAVLTGVRSALLAALLIVIIYMVQSNVRLRAIVAVGALGLVAVFSGALGTATARFETESSEFSSVSTVGSGRGEIWSVAIGGWESEGPLAWLFGTGLRSIQEFEIRELGATFVGHSDVVEVLVQLGLVGFVVWIGLWAGLFRAGLRGLVLIPVLVYAMVNGAIEYVAPLAVAIVLAAGCPPRPRRVKPGEPEPVAARG
ncbi:MAG TPA: O-antigen ligase family protein [Thermoleophilaceae bacterium]|nr:O-antigen ligase family protein [Thermoleophilaceae bacterium]